MKSEQKGPETGSRKPYSTPRLIVYGNLQRLTMAKGGARSDGVGKAVTRTTGKGA